MPIKMQAEPKDFFEKVHKPGREFLAKNPYPKGEREWLKGAYWRKILPELYEVYSGICAYTCHWMPGDTSDITVDHFRPKSKYPQHAYQWDNYRLACGRLNKRKGTHEDIPDPFTLNEGTFEMHFPTLQLIPGQNLSSDEAKKIKKVIDVRLKLNDAICLKARKSWLVKYLRQGDMQFLKEHAPFLAYELIRQQLDDIYHPMGKNIKNRKISLTDKQEFCYTCFVPNHGV